MGNPYTEPTLTGYNSNPPADDGSEVASNEVTWAKHKDKLGDPLKTYAAAVSTNVLAAFALLPFRGITALSTNTTVTTSDRGKFYSLSGTMTLTLPAAATAGDGFTISGQNVGSDVITIDGDSAETINGIASIDIIPEAGFVLTSNGAAWTALLPNNGRVGQTEMNFDAAMPGFLLMRGQTLGNADSGGTHAAEKYKSLFEYLWNNLADGQAAVSSGRGTTATEDFDNDKTITIPDMRGRMMLGKDNMGGSSANIVTDTEADTAGDTAGQETVTETANEMLAHTHGMLHTHGAGSFAATGSAATSSGAGAGGYDAAGTTTITGSSATDSLGGTTDSTGSGNAQDIMNPYMTFNVHIRY